MPGTGVITVDPDTTVSIRARPGGRAMRQSARATYVP